MHSKKIQTYRRYPAKRRVRKGHDSKLTIFLAGLFETTVWIIKYIVEDIIQNLILERLIFPLLKNIFALLFSKAALVLGAGAVAINTYQHFTPPAPEPDTAVSSSIELPEPIPVVPFDTKYLRQRQAQDQMNSQIIAEHRRQSQLSEQLRLRNQPYETFKFEQEQRWKEQARQDLLRPRIAPVTPSVPSYQPQIPNPPNYPATTPSYQIPMTTFQSPMIPSYTPPTARY